MDNRLEEIKRLCLNHPEYCEYQEILSLIVLNTEMISPIILTNIINILEEVKYKGRLEQINYDLITTIFYKQKLQRLKDLDEFITLLLPEKMEQENLSTYLNKFGLIWDSNIEYNGLNNFKKLENNGLKYSDEWSKFPLLPFILCAYFYAHLELFNYDYDVLIELLKNYFKNYQEYIDIYKLSIEGFPSYESAYHFITSIIEDLIIEKKKKHI